MGGVEARAWARNHQPPHPTRGGQLPSAESSNPVLGSISRCFWHRKEPSVSLGTQPGWAGVPLPSGHCCRLACQPRSPRSVRGLPQKTGPLGSGQQAPAPTRCPPGGHRSPPLAHRQSKPRTSSPSQRPDPECGGDEQHAQTHTVCMLTHAWTRVCTMHGHVCALGLHVHCTHPHMCAHPAPPHTTAAPESRAARVCSWVPLPAGAASSGRGCLAVMRVRHAHGTRGSCRRQGL